MKEYQLFIGLDDQCEKKQLIETSAAVQFIAQTLVNAGIEGATMTQGKGLYMYRDGKVGFETCVIVTMLDFTGSTGDMIRAVVPIIKERLNQESVALKSQEVDSILL